MSGKPRYDNFEDSKYEKWIRSLPCVICAQDPVDGHHVDHARNNSYMLIPLCQRHHRPGYPGSYHQLERRRFEDRYNVNCDWIIMRLLGRYIQNKLDV